MIEEFEFKVQVKKVKIVIKDKTHWGRFPTLGEAEAITININKEGAAKSLKVVENFFKLLGFEDAKAITTGLDADDLFKFIAYLIAGGKKN